VLHRWWFAICALTLIIASDYKLRTRDPRAALSGAVDPLILLELFLYGLVGLYLVLYRARPPRVRRTQPHLYLACLFVGLMVLSVFYTAYPQYALVRAVQMCVLLGLTLAAARDATRDDMHRFAHAYIALVSVSVVYGILVKSPPVTPQQVGRFTWLAIHPTVSGVLAGLATMLVVGYLVAGRKPRPGPMWSRSYYWIALLLVGGGTLASQTRGAVVGTVLGILVILLCMRGGRALLEMVAILLVVFLGIGLAFSSQVVTYFERGEDAQQLQSLNTRTNLWETAQDAVEKRPLFGYGVTSARGIFYNATGLGGGHNAIVNVFVELGLVGFITWSALVLTLFVGIRRLPYRRRPTLRFDRALLLAILLFLMVDGIFFEGPGSVANVASTWFFACIAWLAVARRSAGEEPSDPARAGALTTAPSRRLNADEVLQLARVVERENRELRSFGSSGGDNGSGSADVLWTGHETTGKQDDG